MPDSTLLSTIDLAAQTLDPKLVILDVRASLADLSLGRKQYVQGHIPGSRFVDIERDVSGLSTGTNGRHPLPTAQQFCANMQRLGINDDSQIVIYDDGLCNFASRLWFTFRYFGISNVWVLDGGIARWITENRELTTRVQPWEVGHCALGESLEKVFTVRDIEDNLQSQSLTLLDARSKIRFDGLQEPIDPIAGHIPGSLNRPSADNLTTEGIFKSPSTIREEFLSLFGHISSHNVINSCGSGITACCNHLAMLYAGIPAAGVYIGSWSEWIANKTHPLCTTQ